jgi:hypothetical protein
MDAEFINAYVAKQRDYILELVNKNLMLEASLTVTNEKLKVALAEVEKLQKAPSKKSNQATTDTF